jgi:hypothetical protein
MKKLLDVTHYITPYLVVTCGAGMAGYGLSIGDMRMWAIGAIVAGAGAVIGWTEDL